MYCGQLLPWDYFRLARDSGRIATASGMATTMGPATPRAGKQPHRIYRVHSVDTLGDSSTCCKRNRLPTKSTPVRSDRLVNRRKLCRSTPSPKTRHCTTKLIRNATNPTCASEVSCSGSVNGKGLGIGKASARSGVRHIHMRRARGGDIGG